MVKNYVHSHETANKNTNMHTYVCISVGAYDQHSCIKTSPLKSVTCSRKSNN